MHIHDLGGLSLYCCGYSLRDVLMKGVRGVPNIPISVPAKHFDSALSQLANLITVLQNEILGAVAFNSFDTLLAPFIKADRLTEKQVKQSMQNFIFAINSNSRAGAEPAFSNLTFDLTPPADMLNDYCIIGGVPVSFTYGSCQQEMDMLNRAFFDIMLEGDGEGKLFAYPIPTYNIHSRFDWDNPNNAKLWEMAGKYGTPYFANFVNSDLDISDVRSMAILGTQNLIYKDAYGRVSKNEVRHLVHNWMENGGMDYSVLMNGRFVRVTDMFEIPYEDYDKYVVIELANGQKQNFSYDHKCVVVRDDAITEVFAQNVLPTDKILLARHPYSESNIGTYESGKIVGYYLAEGWTAHGGAEICFAINENRTDIVEAIVTFFEKNYSARTNVVHDEDGHIFKVKVYSKAAVSFVRGFIAGDKAISKRITCSTYDTSDSFRRGLYDGYLETDGSEAKKLFAHTTNKYLCFDMIDLFATIGKYFTFQVNEHNTRYFKPDKSDLIHFTSYRLIITEPEVFNEDYYCVGVKQAKLVKAGSINTVYNFTVDTDDHLYELPNGIITHQCCRLQLNLKELRKRNGGLFGSGDSTGSIGVVTINLPRLGYECRGDREKFFAELGKYCDLAKESLEIKRRWLQENVIETHLIPAFMEYVGTLDNHFCTIGIVGMNEMCENFMGKDILDPEAKQFCLDVGEFIRGKLVAYQEETGHLYNYEATPAESTAYRFALKDKETYPDIITQGSGKNVYYTNSCHIPVKKVTSISETFAHQEALQKQFTGGTVIHCYLDGAISGEQAKQIVKETVTNFGVPYMSLSPISRYCPDHGYIKDRVDKCPICKQRLQKYQRITGYLRAVDNFNPGKAAEFADRNQL